MANRPALFSLSPAAARRFLGALGASVAPARLLPAVTPVVALLIGSAPAFAQSDIAAPGVGAQPVTTAADPETVSLGDVVITGESFETDPATGLLTVLGKPVARKGNDELRAVRLVIDPRNRLVTAEGEVYLKQERQELRANRLTYSFDTREGEAQRATTAYEGYFVKADIIYIKAGVDGPFYDARKAHWTTCDKLHPHYQYSARSVLLFPQKRVVARQADITLLSTRLVTIPKITRPLGPAAKQEDSLYPALGYNSVDGFYAEKDFHFVRKPYGLDGVLRLNTQTLPSGGVLFGSGGRLQWVASAYFRDEAENQRSSHLKVSRLPEAGLIWSNSQGKRIGRFLSHQVTGVRFDEDLEFSDRWKWAMQISGGYFMQHQDRASSLRTGGDYEDTRGTVQGQAVLPYVKLGPLRLNDLRFMARQTYYGSGDAYSVLGTGIGKRVYFGNLRLSVQRFDQWTSGSTPFLFDAVELRQEWRPGLEYHTPGFNFAYYARLRGNNAELYDQVFAVSRLFHCIEPRLTYSVRRAELFFDFRIPLMSPGSRSRPLDSRTQDPANGGRPPNRP